MFRDIILKATDRKGRHGARKCTTVTAADKQTMVSLRFNPRNMTLLLFCISLSCLSTVASGSSNEKPIIGEFTDTLLTV